MAVSKTQSLQQISLSNSNNPEGIPLLLAILQILHSLVKNATIELPNGVRVFVDHDSHEQSIRFNCDKAHAPCEQPCQDLFPFAIGRGQTIGICKQLATLGCSPELTGETPGSRGDDLSNIQEVLSALDPKEKAKLLAMFCETEFKALLDANVKLEDLQPLQYWVTNRINRLKTTNRKSPKRPVKAQRKVGNYLYTLQPGQKGGDYWCLHFSSNGKRRHIHLGKETPTFDPEADLAKKQKPLTQSAHA